MAITKIGTPELFDFSATNTALQLPTGDTASRPTSPSTGEWRFNSQLKYVEYYDGAAWFQIDTEGADVLTPAENFNTNTYFGTSATQAIDAKFNEAANFNGSSSKIVLPSYSTTFRNNFSVSLWFNINIIPSGGIVSFITGQLDYYFYCFFRDSDKKIETRCEIGGTGFIVKSNTTFSNNSGWYHVSVTKSSADGLKLYVNGSLENSDSGATGNLDTSSTASVIGAYGNTEYYFSGKIDQVRIFNDALTAGEAGDLYTDETTTTAATLDFPSGAGCIAAYQLDGNGNDLSTNYNGTTTDIGYTGLQFQTDFTWIKRTDGTENHYLQDSVRGSTQQIYSNLSNAQYNETTAVTSFTSNGFNIGSYNGINNSGEDYVAWNWKAGGNSNTYNKDGTGYSTASAAGLTTGSLTPTGSSVNTANGFSIIKVNSGSSTADVTVSHGLGVKPSFVLFKKLNSEGGGWFTWAAGMSPESYYLYLNEALGFSGLGQSGNIWGNQSFTSDVISFRSGYTVEINRDVVIYAWAEISGYSNIGAYTGTGGTLTVYTTDDGSSTGSNGFQPRFVMIKRTTGGNGNWVIIDNKRDSGDSRLYPNNNLAEDTGQGESFISNGFTPRQSSTNDTNILGSVYIYMAFA